MEYLDGWELVPGLDVAPSSTKHGAAQSPPVSPRLDTQKENPAPTIIIAEAIEEETELVDIKSLESKSKSFDDEEEDDSGEGGFDVWKWGWGLTGIGALMFVLVLGAAAAGGGSGIGIQTKNHHHIGGFKDNQRLKEMVSAVRGGSVPLTRAHITFGGYYDASSLNH